MILQGSGSAGFAREHARLEYGGGRFLNNFLPRLLNLVFHLPQVRMHRDRSGSMLWVTTSPRRAPFEGDLGLHGQIGQNPVCELHQLGH